MLHEAFAGRDKLPYDRLTPIGRSDVIDPETKSAGAFSPHALAPTGRGGYPPDKAMARKAIPTDIRSLCRAYTEESIRHLAAIMRQREYSPAARVQAASILLDRGWGKPPQAHSGADGEGGIEVVIRYITECGEQRHPVQIEAQPVETSDQL